MSISYYAGLLVGILVAMVTLWLIGRKAAKTKKAVQYDERQQFARAKAYSVQMTVMPEGDVALLISPDSNSGLATAIEELKKHLTGLQETLSTTKTEINSTKEVPTPSSVRAIASGKDEEVTDQYVNTPLWAILPNLDAAIGLCKKVPKFDGVKSTLFRYGNDYYIKMNFELTRRQISSIILVVAEYASQMFTEEFDGAFLSEHGTVLCEDCVNKLSAI